MIPDITALVERLRRKGRGIMPYNPDGHEAADALIRLSADAARVGEMRKALAWYAQHGEDCRKITPVGDVARQALDADGGKRARAALAPASSEGEERS